MSITTWQNRAGRGVIGRMVAEIEELRAELEKVTREAHENKDKARWVNAELERIKSQEPVAWVRFSDGEVDYDADAVISNTEGDCMDEYIEWRPVFLAAGAQPTVRESRPVQPVRARALTNNEWFAFWLKCDQVDYESAFPDFLLLARAIEARFGIKAPS